MFWTASDILKKRIDEKRVQEAENIFRALLRVQPNIDDKDGKAQTAMMHHALRLSEVSAAFSMLDFVEALPVEALTDADWKSLTPPPLQMERGVNTPFPPPPSGCSPVRSTRYRCRCMVTL